MDEQINQQTQNSQPFQDNQQQTWSEKLIELRIQWTNEIKDLGKEMNSLNNLDKLQTVIYAKRQDLVNLYYSVMNLWQKKYVEYRKKLADLYNSFKTGTNGIRYTTDSAIALQSEAILSNEKILLDEIKTFTEFLWESLKTLDNIIYAMKDKLKIVELQHGVRF